MLRTARGLLCKGRPGPLYGKVTAKDDERWVSVDGRHAADALGGVRKGARLREPAMTAEEEMVMLKLIGMTAASTAAQVFIGISTVGNILYVGTYGVIFLTAYTAPWRHYSPVVVAAFIGLLLLASLGVEYKQSLNAIQFVTTVAALMFNFFRL